MVDHIIAPPPERPWTIHYTGTVQGVSVSVETTVAEDGQTFLCVEAPLPHDQAPEHDIAPGTSVFSAPFAHGDRARFDGSSRAEVRAEMGREGFAPELIELVLEKFPLGTP